MIVYKSLPRISAITFDIDDTFYDNTPIIRAAEKSLSNHIEKTYPAASALNKPDWLRFKKDALASDPSLQHDMGSQRKAVLTKAFMHIQMSPELIPNAVEDCFTTFYNKRSDFSVRQEIVDVLSALAQHFSLVAITNGNVDCEAIGISNYFKHVLHAGKDGRMKPNPDMFDKASNLLAVPPANILHVGDNLEKDVKGAINAGYSSAWYADDRKMLISNEVLTVLPHIQLRSLSDLIQLIPS
ncbi:HAD-IA family hydrolase [Glaciecola sp. 1036]|uniref:HAD-IA family hydrolase n=1 Tax=Alteromonadaceae TaxID=72275 RepID=UPI003D069E0E